MKCVSGYYYLEKWQIEMEDIVFIDELKENNGDEKFIKIETGASIFRETYGGLQSLNLYICPKCYTVKAVL